ncbi:innexin inx2-like isoform X1 [Eriocheir sinensis]|nr:innexin inx2-like isoform X1 [Eriocheir sinensis]XP_050696254.1 innexin inx2-like isoform X1 [Eriocheir sinensis]XP_050696255.1 innexin inx2-like isoform X1 [Eriocheir sinensis]
MPSIGAGSVDIRSILSSVLNVIKSRANQICSATCDGLVLRMHYRWTFCLLVGNFLTVWYSWYHRDVITCVSHFNAETQVRLDYINICLSYPYVDENGSRRYILFYRWISWSLLVLAGVYYIPRKVSKGFDNARCKKLLEDLASNAHRYDQLEDQLVERAARYVIYNLKTHNGLYWKYLGVNVLALAVDLFAMQYLDFILQGRFIQYGFKAFPFDRDPRTFTDYMSQTFPPFASCELSNENQLVNKRTEKFGCHLTIMELYEKVFLGLWLWLIILIFVTCCYIVFLLTMWLPCMRAYMLRTAKPVHANEKVRNVIQTVSKNCKIGDIYLLYRLKGHFSHARFYELLTRLSDPSLCKQLQQPGAPGATPEGKDKVPPNKQQDTLRNRRPMQQDPPINPDYLQQYLASPEMMRAHPQHPDQRTPLLKKNTSILIE